MSEAGGHTGSSDTRNFTLLMQTAAFKPKPELSWQITGDLSCSLCHLCCFRGVREGLVTWDVQRLWWAGIPSALGTHSWEEQGEEGPSSRWVCEALQRWGQLQRE